MPDPMSHLRGWVCLVHSPFKGWVCLVPVPSRSVVRLVLGPFWEYTRGWGISGCEYTRVWCTGVGVDIAGGITEGGWGYARYTDPPPRLPWEVHPQH